METNVKRSALPGQETIHYDCETNPASPQAALQQLLNTSLIFAEDWQTLPNDARDEVLQCKDVSKLFARLVHHGLLTSFQADRIQSFGTFGLILGNYRVL